MGDRADGPAAKLALPAPALNVNRSTSPGRSITPCAASDSTPADAVPAIVVAAGMFALRVPFIIVVATAALLAALLRLVGWMP